MKKRTIVTMILTATMLSGLFTGCGTKESVETTAPVSKVEKVSNDAKKSVEKTIAINVTADKGWDKDSTPAIVHITMKDTDEKTKSSEKTASENKTEKSGEKTASEDKTEKSNKKTEIDFYHAVNADEKGGKGSSTVKLAEGTYTVEFVSPLNKDGSAYEIYDTEKAQEIVVSEDDEEVVVDCPMTQIPADKVTDEMVKDIVDKTQEAVEKGDTTLKGDAGKDILDKLDKNVSNSPNASEETKKDAETEKDKADTESKPAETVKTEETKSENKGGTDNKSASSANKNTTSSGNNGNTGNTGASKPAESKPAESKPAHVHSWKEHTATRQVWVPNIVTVDDYETQTVTSGFEWHCTCGAVISGDKTDHVMNHILNGEPSNGYALPFRRQKVRRLGRRGRR